MNREFVYIVENSGWPNQPERAAQTIISKVSEKELLQNNPEAYEMQISSLGASKMYEFTYYETLESAIDHAYAFPDEIEYVGMSDDEIQAAKDAYAALQQQGQRPQNTEIGVDGEVVKSKPVAEILSLLDQI